MLSLKGPKFVLCFLTLFIGNFAFAKVNNLHLIDEEDNGFALYRYGAPSKDDVKEMCDMGIDEVMVLSGTAEQRELKYIEQCPHLKVVYNIKQSANKPVTPEFLNYFDQWVQEAKASGKKIAFRCECGCHRTGRLAAYYQMKYQHITVADAVAIMNKHGKYMVFHPQLKHQVADLKDYIEGRPCQREEKYCVPR